MEKRLGHTVVYSCPQFNIEEVAVQVPGGLQETRWYVVKRDAVGIVPITDDGKILMTREYRSAVGEVQWRIPAGGINDGEQPLEAAHRELREETGYDAKTIKPLLETNDPSAIIKQKSYFFLATGLFSSPLDAGEWEGIELAPQTPDQVRNLIAAAQINSNIARALLAALKIL